MQAQRKFEQPAPMVERDEAWSPSGLSGAPSPAHLLWEELAARLQQAHPQTMPAASAGAAAAKWPMPARFATVVGLSAASWGAIYIVVASFF